MINEAILSKAGFVKVSEGCYSRQLGELTILLEVSETSFIISVPCASSTIDYEPRIDESIKSCFEGFSRINAAFNDRMITITSLPSDSEITSDELCEILALIKRVQQKLDLLPVCTRCKRVITVKTVVRNEKAEILCGICSDEDELEKKHKEQIEYFRRLEKERIKKQRVHSHVIYKAFFAGIKCSIPVCVLGFVCMWVGLFFIPIFRFMAFFLGMLLGFLTMIQIKKPSAITTVVRYLIVTSAALISVFVISTINVFAVDRFFSSVFGLTLDHRNIPLFNDMAIINLFFGIGGMFVAQTAAAWSKEDELKSI